MTDKTETPVTTLRTPDEIKAEYISTLTQIGEHEFHIKYKTALVTPLYNKAATLDAEYGKAIKVQPPVTPVQ